MLAFDGGYRRFGIIAGADEAGRGPLAGPVVAAAVVFPENCGIIPVDDSKRLSAARRASLSGEIAERAVSFSVGVIGPGEIDDINILEATKRAMRLAVKSLAVAPHMVLVDGNAAVDFGGGIIGECVVRGDSLSFSIAAASIMAKVARDNLMLEYDKEFPGYGFAKHKGYGTRGHAEALRRLGPCPIHRRSFLKNIL